MLHLTQQVLLLSLMCIFPFIVIVTLSSYLGNLYIVDTSNNRIRKVTVSTGIITKYAGNSTDAGYSGDNGEATSATLFYPVAIAVDSAGISYCYVTIQY